MFVNISNDWDIFVCIGFEYQCYINNYSWEVS